ncbi:MAG: 4Fe-4S dicluster domain-containing protein [Clostridiales bacterium]|nr:4Fe-4S dicluster domain-containing protein [Clostridiales bacterium]
MEEDIDMIFKLFKELQISQLGLGNMRLPTEGFDGAVKEKEAREIIEYAYENGINYFDTAFGYVGGESERIVGKILNQYPRDTWYLATKMPGHMMKYKDGKLGFSGYMAGSDITSIAQIFEQQLEKCGVDYFDFYLLHNMCETAFDFYTNEELGVVRYLLEQKKAGRIRHLGFSTHARTKTIEQFLDIYPDTFEFVQIQLNYMDWTLQEAGRKNKLLTDRGIPVISMGSLRGGSLAKLTDEAAAMLKEARPNDSIASWAFRFLQSLPNLQIALSGMENLDTLKENIALFSNPSPTTPAEIELLQKAIAPMMNLVPCTSCRYCTDSCPAKLDIPKLISLYNEASYEKAMWLVDFTLGAMNENELPGACVECGACSALCPQSIDIPDIMKKFDNMIKNPPAPQR